MAIPTSASRFAALRSAAQRARAGLPPALRAWVDGQARQISLSPAGAERLRQLVARSAGRSAAPAFGRPELQAKAVCLLVEAAVAERDRLRDQKDSVSAMNQQDMLLLQQMMEKQTQLEQMISNVMKAGYEGGQAAVSNLKAS